MTNMRKGLISVVRIIILTAMLLLTQGVWRFYYLAYVPELAEQRGNVSISDLTVASYLLDFTIAWQRNYLVWTWLTVATILFLCGALCEIGLRSVREGLSHTWGY